MAEEKAKVTLHWLNQSRAQRIVWLLEECKGLDYDIKVYKRGKDMLAPKELKEVHPTGKSPVIEVAAPGMKTKVIAESGFMTEYLAEYFAPHLIPKRYEEGKEGKVGGETEQWLRYRYYMHYAEGSLMTLLLVAIFVVSAVLKIPDTHWVEESSKADEPKIRNAPVPFFIKPITRSIGTRVDTMFLNANFKTQFGFLEEQLKTSPDGGQYLCGKDLTAADILMSFPLIAGKSKIDAAAYPTLTAYSKMLEDNEVNQRSVKKLEDLTGESQKSML